MAKEQNLPYQKLIFSKLSKIIGDPSDFARRSSNDQHDYPHFANK